MDLSLLGVLVLFVTLVGPSSQEFYWKNNKIVRQYQMADSSSYPSSSGGSSYPSQGGSSYPSQGGSQYPSQGGSGGYPSGGSGGSGYPSGGSGDQVEPWRQFVRQNEPFSCSGKQDGFYASRWCNVFYRCFYGIKSEFLCAVQTNGDRLWWTQHSTSQDVPQQSAQCVYPCAQKRQCTSPGGILKDQGPVSESTSDAQRILASCPANVNYGPGSPGQTIPDNSNDQFRVPEPDNYCQGVPDGGFVANPKYCNVFHVCIQGNRKDFECAKTAGGQYDLWWNDATKRCEYPCLLQCSKGIFGSNAQPAQIQSTDRQVNSALCGGGNSGYPSGGSGNGAYPSGGSSSNAYPSGGSSMGGNSYSMGGSSMGGYSSGGSSYPSGGSNSYSSGGSNSYPSGGSNSYPSGGSNSYPSGGSNSYPSGGSSNNNNNNYYGK